MKLIRFNKNFPYRTLGEILTLNDITKIFNNNPFYGTDFKDINDRLAIFFYNRYKNRYPHEQDAETLQILILELKDTYIDTFYNNIIRVLNKKDITKSDYGNMLLQGNELKYSTKSGSSANPYNISFNQTDEINEVDELFEKNLSETKQTNTIKDIVKRTNDIMHTKINGEIVNFVNSFYSLFTQIDLTPYIEKELEKILYAYKDIINDIIECYNDILPKIKKIKGGNNGR